MARQVFWETWLVRLAAGGGFCRCLRRGRVCNHLRWGEIFRKLGLYACPAGAYFCSYKSRQNTLGALPQDPCRLQCWIRIDLRREPKSIRTAHRIAPKVAAGASALSPHPLSRWRERGSDGLASARRQSIARGVRACKNRKPLTHGYG